MPDASQQRSDQRLAVGEKKEQPQERPPFSVTDDLREPIDELTRLKDMEAKTREIIQKYQAAMREMEVRFEILDQDLNLKKHRNPIHHVESRIKKPARSWAATVRSPRSRTWSATSWTSRACA